MTEARSKGERLQAKLKQLARQKGWDVQNTMLQYTLERLLYRLQQNGNAKYFQLKGSLSVMRWTGAETSHRPTEDMDLNGLRQGQEITIKDTAKAIVKAMRRDEDDGLQFDERSVEIRKEREGNVPGGKLNFDAYLGDTHIRVRVDVGFGNPVNPDPPRDTIDPLVKGMAAPRMEVYPLETTVAEKVSAALNFGLANTRLKDIYDLWHIAGAHEEGFDGETLKTAFAGTFAHQQVSIPEGTPEGFSDAFVEQNRKAWAKFVRNKRLTDAPDIDEAMARVRAFVVPVLSSLKTGDPAPEHWTPAEGWDEQPRYKPAA